MTAATITTIRSGYLIKTSDMDLEVVGSMKMRSGYKYICKTKAGKKVSIDRNDLIEAQRDGSATICVPTI